MASPTLLIVSPTPRADATHPRAAILRPIVLSAWNSTHTSDLKRIHCRDHLQSLQRRPQWPALDKGSESLRNNSLREYGSNYRRMSTANRDSSLSYLRRSSASSRRSADIITGKPRHKSAPVGVYTDVLHPTSLHAPSSPYTSRLCKHETP